MKECISAIRDGERIFIAYCVILAKRNFRADTSGETDNYNHALDAQNTWRKLRSNIYSIFDDFTFGEYFFLHATIVTS